jgi:hypothetical protein
MSILLVGAFIYNSEDESFSIAHLNPVSFFGNLANSIGIGIGDQDSNIQFNINKGGDEELLDIWTDKLNTTTMIVYIDFAKVEGQSYEDTKAEYHRRVAEAGRDIRFVPIIKTKKPSEFEVSDNYIDLTNANNFTITYDKLRAGYEIRIGWGSVVAESSASSLATEPPMNDKFCIDVNGNYHIAYINSNSTTAYGNSTDKGLTWTNTELPNFMMGSHTEASLNCNGTTVYIQYKTDFTSFPEAYQVVNTDNFGTEVPITDFGSTTFGSAGRYSCALDGLGATHCCAIDDTNADVMHYINKTAGAGSFTDQGSITTGSDDTDQCDIEVTTDNEVFIVGSGTDQDDVDIFSSRDGFTRHEVYAGVIMPNPGREPNIAITPENEIWIAFMDANDLIACNGTNASLTSWSCKEIDTANSLYPDIAINDRNDIVIAYQTQVSDCAGDLVYAFSSDGINWKNRTTFADQNNSCYVGLPYSQYPTSNRVTNNLPYIYTSNASTVFKVYYDNLTIVDAPSIYFTDPTPANATITSNRTLDLNVSVDGYYLDTLKWNWNGTNYTIYNDSLQLMMNFNNRSSLGENDTKTVGVSDQAHTGTAINTIYNATGGVYGGAFEFNGKDSQISLGDSPGLDILTEDKTYSAWVKVVPKATTFHVIMSDGGTSASNGIWFSVNDGTGLLQVWIADGTPSYLINGFTGSTNIMDGEYHHVAFVWDRSIGGKFYVDGNEDGSESTTGTVNITSSAKFTIGAHEYSVSSVLNGSIDEPRVWGRALSGDEIKQAYMSNLRKINDNTWSLQVNQTQNSTTGLVDGEYSYYAYAKNDYADAPNSNKTDTRIITIDTDITPPDINIVFPTNNTNSTDNNLDVNYTVSDPNLASCWYSNDTYTKNTTITCGVNITTIIWSEGQHNVTVWANDTNGQENHSSVRFTIDTIPPSFDNLPANQTIYNNQSLSYDIDATDTGFGLGTFGINWTTVFSINKTTGLLTNISLLNVANYTINVSINDTLGNTNYSLFTLNVLNSTLPDTNPPTFTNLQNHTQLANLSFNFDLDATDPQGIDTFILNQTNFFSINSTGTITNNTPLSSPQIHWLLVSVNDTLGNSATGEFYINITPPIPVPQLNESKIAKIYPSIENQVPYVQINQDLLFP